MLAGTAGISRFMGKNPLGQIAKNVQRVHECERERRGDGRYWVNNNKNKTEPVYGVTFCILPGVLRTPGKKQITPNYRQNAQIVRKQI